MKRSLPSRCDQPPRVEPRTATGAHRCPRPGVAAPSRGRGSPRREEELIEVTGRSDRRAPCSSGSTTRMPSPPAVPRQLASGADPSSARQPQELLQRRVVDVPGLDGARILLDALRPARRREDRSKGSRSVDDRVELEASGQLADALPRPRGPPHALAAAAAIRARPGPPRSLIGERGPARTGRGSAAATRPASTCDPIACGRSPRESARHGR